VPLSTRDCWIFDMDGTLTVAAHDFDAIRSELGLPPGLPILEEIARRPVREIEVLTRRLDEIELEIAQRSRPQADAAATLAQLCESGVRLGILTRNSERLARVTLEASGLSDFFSESSIVGRESCPPKPEPDGIFELLRRWKARPEQAVMIGDFKFDLEAGRRAGTATVHFDAEALADAPVRSKEDAERVLKSRASGEDWSSLADHRVSRIAALLDLRSNS
jgi:HAD superfamily hydrolase (TIGR01509 family)